MIPYEDLVAALARWRDRHGLPSLYTDYLGDMPRPQAAAPVAPPALARPAPPASRPAPPPRQAEPVLEPTSVIDLHAVGAPAPYPADDAQSWDAHDAFDDDLDGPAYAGAEPDDAAERYTQADLLSTGDSTQIFGLDLAAAPAAPAAPALPYGSVEEHTTIGIALAPATGTPAPARSVSSYDMGVVPSEPVYDSLGAAAEYQAEQGFGFGGHDADRDHTYVPQGYGGAPPADYPHGYDAHAQPAGHEDAYAPSEPPPLDPPPEDDFLLNFDEPDKESSF